MVKVFNFNIERAKRLNLYLDELYVLDWVLYFYSHRRVVYSKEQPEYFVLTCDFVQENCNALRHKSLRQIGTILKRLCGDAPESVKGEVYPLSCVFLTERKFRNNYYKINPTVIKHLMGKEKFDMRDEYSIDDKLELENNFIELYKKIEKIYNFKHNLQKPTKALMDAQQHVQNIMDKSYIQRMSWDNVWLQQQDLSALEEPSETLILSAIKEYAKAVAPGGWLAKSPQSLSLSRFFYNPQTQKSMFVKMLQTQKRVPLTDEELDYFNTIIRKFASTLKLEMNDIAFPMYEIYDFWYKYFYKLEEYQPANRKHYWTSHFGSSPKFGILVSIYTEFLKKRQSRYPITKFDVGKNSKTWYSFAKYVYTDYNKLKIEFNANFYKRLQETLDFIQNEDYNVSNDTGGEDE